MVSRDHSSERNAFEITDSTGFRFESPDHSLSFTHLSSDIKCHKIIYVYKISTSVNISRIGT